MGTTSDKATGTLQNVSISGDFASAKWVYVVGGEQPVLLTKGDNGWLIAQDTNDFPTALLHFCDG